VLDCDGPEARTALDVDRKKSDMDASVFTDRTEETATRISQTDRYFPSITKALGTMLLAMESLKCGGKR
jgi:hypothetical protein